LVETYYDEPKLEGFGLYVNKELGAEVIVFEKVAFNEKYEYILLCQSFINLADHTNGILPVDLEIFQETDTYFRIDEDLRFFREIKYIMENHPNKEIGVKYQKVLNIYRLRNPTFFTTLENDGFVPFTLNEKYTGNINPFELLAEKEMRQ
jgi:hypothetical protein